MSLDYLNSFKENYFFSIKVKKKKAFQISHKTKVLNKF